MTDTALKITIFSFIYKNLTIKEILQILITPRQPFLPLAAKTPRPSLGSTAQCHCSKAGTTRDAMQSDVKSPVSRTYMAWSQNQSPPRKPRAGVHWRSHPACRLTSSTNLSESLLAHAIRRLDSTRFFFGVFLKTTCTKELQLHHKICVGVL